MNVFVLCTGRTASSTLEQACSVMTNYGAGHETLARELGTDRLAYPLAHIEIDNRLVWFLEELEAKYGNSAFYVHLVRDEVATAASFNRRWGLRSSIVRWYCEGVLMTPIELIAKKDRLKICERYCRLVNAKIEAFLTRQERTIRIRVEHLETDFRAFWEAIGAEGDLEEALQELRTHYNVSKKKGWKDYKYAIKLLLLRWKNFLLG